ncbi:MAG: hypothetical protein EOO11_22405, partial [Chitinophagaceae bacterium]
MDELWRKAGNEFPLHTGGADWDKVAAKLGIAPEPKRKDRRYLWLLLLLLLPVVCIRPFPLGLGEKAAGPAARQADGSEPTQGAAGDAPVVQSNAWNEPGASRISTDETTPVIASTPQQPATGVPANGAANDRVGAPVADGVHPGTKAGPTTGVTAAAGLSHRTGNTTHARKATAAETKNATRIPIAGAALAGRRTGTRPRPTVVKSGTGDQQPVVAGVPNGIDASGKSTSQTQQTATVANVTPPVASTGTGIDTIKKADTAAIAQKAPVADTMIATPPAQSTAT